MRLTGLLATVWLATTTWCALTYYATNDNIWNGTCVKFERTFSPCGSFEYIVQTLNYQSGHHLSIILLDSWYIVTETIYLNLTSLSTVEIKPWINDTLAIVNCEYDFSVIISGVDTVNLESIEFQRCGKSTPLLQFLTVHLVHIHNAHFMRSTESSLIMSSYVYILEVINSSFTDAVKEPIMILSQQLTNATFQRVDFKRNSMYSLWVSWPLWLTLNLTECSFIDNHKPIKMLRTHSLIIVRSSFIRNSPYGAIVVSDANSITIVSSLFSNNTASLFGAGGLSALSSIPTLTIYNTSFNYNRAGQSGGALYISGNTGSSIFIHCTFIGNTAESYEGGGGAIYKRGGTDSTITVIGCDFFVNEAEYFGGAIAIFSVETFLINSSNFRNNLAINGGALQFQGQLVELVKCTFNGNYAYNTGGALNIDAIEIHISESNWTSNYALSGNNGGAMNASGYLTIISSNFFSNSAKSGGAVALYDSNASFNQTSFIGNVAREGNGGAILIIGGNVTVSVDGCMFIENTALLGQGGVLHSSPQQLEINFSSFINNSAREGGALNIQSESGELFIFKSNFTGNSATFDKGGALSIYAKLMSFTICNFIGNIAAGSGGALNLVVTEFVSKSNNFQCKLAIPDDKWEVYSKSTTVSHSKFTKNTAHKGGGAFNFEVAKIFKNCQIDNSSASFNENFTRLVITYTKFSHNNAKMGGALNIEGTNHAHFFKCSFYCNKAEVMGGALSLSKNQNMVYLRNSGFLKNSATSYGGALAFDSVLFKEQIQNGTCNTNNFNDIININSITVIDSTMFVLNTVTTEPGMGGALVVHGSLQTMKSENTCVNVIISSCIFEKNTANTGGGIYSYFSQVLAQNITVQENVANFKGGGIALKRTQFYFKEDIKFLRNKVTSNSDGKGGAIYVNDLSEDCNENPCAISWTIQTALSFMGNIALEGPSIYGGMLDRCTSIMGLTGTNLEQLRVNGYSYDLRSYGITSKTINFCFCSDCKLRRSKESLYPGQSFTVNLVCVDQLSQPVNDCIVRADFYQSTEFQLGQGENKQEITGCSSIRYHALSDQTGLAVLEIVADIFCKASNWSKLIVDIKFKPCPLGFELYDKQCQCDKRLGFFKDLICDINNETLIVQHTEWFSYQGGLLRAQKSCPLNYCLKGKKYISPKDPDSQCAYNRGGILCGGCVANHSVVLGSWKCMDCSHLSRYNFIWLTALLALAGVVLVVFLLLVKMTVSSGTTNGLIFYANILSFSGLLDYGACTIHPILRVFLSWINLDLGIEVCYYSGMDVYQKTWFQFIFPFYIWFLVGVIILFCHYSSRVMKLMGMRNIEVLATLFLLSYAKLLKTIVTTFSFINIMVAQAENVSDPLLPTRVWVYDGSITYFQGQHLPLFIICLLFLIFLFFPYTLFLTLGHYLQYLPRRKGLKFFHGTLITTIIDAYHAPYQKSHRYWTGLGLLIRCILFTIFATSSGIEANIFWIGAASVFLLSVKLFTRNHIYRNKLVDFLETFSLINLLVLAIVFTTETFCNALTASISLAMIECATVIVFHIQQEMRKKDILQKYFIIIFQRFKKKNIQPSQEEKQPETVQKEPSVSYIQLRESLLEH